MTMTRTNVGNDSTNDHDHDFGVVVLSGPSLVCVVSIPCVIHGRL